MSFQAFSHLIQLLDSANGKLDKIQIMADYFKTAAPSDAAWAVFFLSGQRLKRLVSSRLLREVFLAKSGISEWLYTEAYMATGDTAETISLLHYQLPHVSTEWDVSSLSLNEVMNVVVIPLYGRADRDDLLHQIWVSLPSFDCFVFNKLISGAFRIGVSQGLLVLALSEVSQLDAGLLQHRLMGHWEPDALFYTQLIAAENLLDKGIQITQPYPFYLASPLDVLPEQLPDVWPNLLDWQLEWKWDGIRGQWIQRQGISALWSRGEELISERFPEIVSVALPDGTVLDGEIMAWQHNKPLPFAQLQQRIGRKLVSEALKTKIPVIFQAYDLLEFQGEDIRHWPLIERRVALENLVTTVNRPELLGLSPVVQAHSWADAADQQQQARALGVEGLMIKHKHSPYRVGRKKGDWWKWKLSPLTADVVMTMAQVGHGKRGNRFTDYTFAIFDENRQLVPIAKAYSGLTDAELSVLDKWIRQHTLAKFGPVRQVPPQQVFELGFEGIALSNRHKSGLAVRFPRILRWRQDKPVEEIDTVDNLKQLLSQITPTDDAILTTDMAD